MVCHSKIKQQIISLLKSIFGIHQNQSLTYDNFIKNLHLKFGPVIFKKRYTASDIILVLKKMGLKEGDNVFIHCSWDEFYNYDGTEKDLIDAIISVIGSDGTLIMPAYPLKKKGKVFNVKKTVTAAGLLSETFRKYPGVKRSINVDHSVCALGPQSDFLVSEHQLSETCWDEKSPYYKLSQINAKVISLGLNKYFVGTMVHCVESILRNEVDYFRDFFSKEKKAYDYIDWNGEQKQYYSYYMVVRRETPFSKSRKMMNRYFEKADLKHERLSNLDISMVEANRIIPRMIELGRQGITICRKPSTKGYKFQTQKCNK